MIRKQWSQGIALCALALLLMLPSTAMGKSKIVLDVTPRYQADYQHILFEYKGEGKSVQSSGCGAVCVSMALEFLLPDLAQTPDTLLLWAYENNLYQGQGLSIKTIQQMLTDHGLEVTSLGEAPRRLRLTLRQGSLIIAYMGKGIFTQNGHYILICGIDENDQLLVIDPNSPNLSMRWYPMETIFGQLGASAGLLVCKAPSSSLSIKMETRIIR